MDTQKETRFLKELEALGDRLAKRPAPADRILRRIGQLEGRYPSIARYYRITAHPLAPEAPPTPPQKPRKKARTPTPGIPRIGSITWEKTTKRDTRKNLTGAYVIETSETDLSASDIWSLYTTLTRVEKAFRSLKTDLGIRPIHHQTADRSRAHLFISVLAYFLLAMIEYQLGKKGDSRSWATIRDILSTHVRTSVSGIDPHTRIRHTVRQSSMPEPAHKAVYTTLGVKDPSRKVQTRTSLKEVSREK